MQLKVIKTDSEHEAAMNALLALMGNDPQEGTPEADELEVLALLIETYEEEHFPIALPDPIEAIRFRMDQQNLTQKDLVPFIGAAARVSEVMNHKRPLSLNMIRKLSEGLGIPAKVLIKKPELLSDCGHDEWQWSKFPLKELHERGYLDSPSNKLADLKEYAEELVKGFLKSIDLPAGKGITPALLRSTLHQRGGRPMNQEALYIWQLLVQKQVMENPLSARYTSIDESLMCKLVQLSWSEKGPLLAKELLNQHGIHLVIEPHFKQTYLDGAAFWGVDGNPVIALTLRYDRLDNFWFTLMHELAHVYLHLDVNHPGFFDDLRTPSDTLDDPESEADELAGRILIDEELWSSTSFHAQTPVTELEQFAQQHNIHISIVAGRIQYETQNYRCHRQLVGNKQVRCQFGR